MAPRAPRPETDRELLATLVARVCRVERAALTIEQRCERCGGAHGRPRVLKPSGVHVSLSRAGGTVVVAVSLVGPVGVDIESVSAVRRAGFDDVAFSRPERAALQLLPVDARDRARAGLWTAKEALLKLSGEGLTVDPRGLTVGWDGAGAWALWDWPTTTLDLVQVHLEGFDAGPGLVGTLASLGTTPPRVRLRRET